MEINVACKKKEVIPIKKIQKANKGKIEQQQ